MAKKSSPDNTPDATKKTHSIRFTDAEWDRISARAKVAGLSISAYLVAASDAADGTAAEGREGTSAMAGLSDQERSAFRAIWFLYTDRLTRMKDAGEQPRIDALVAEARRKFG